MVPPQIATEAGGALDRPRRTLIEGDPLRQQAGRDQPVEVAFGSLEAVEIGDAVFPEPLKGVAKRPAAFPRIAATSSEKGTGIPELRAEIALAAGMLA